MLRRRSRRENQTPQREARGPADQCRGCRKHLEGNFMIQVTGGAGFIGANFVLDWLNTSDEAELNVDKLTYAGNLGTLKSQQGNAKHVFVRADICDRSALDALFAEHKPRAVLHFAAESHVD